MKEITIENKPTIKYETSDGKIYTDKDCAKAI